MIHYEAFSFYIFNKHVVVDKDIKKAILSKPETNIELGEIVGATMSIVKSVKKGNSVTYNKYKIK